MTGCAFTDGHFSAGYGAGWVLAERNKTARTHPEPREMTGCAFTDGHFSAGYGAGWVLAELL